MGEETVVRRKHEPRPSRFQRLWTSYRVELIGLVVAGLGIFLLFEQLNLRRSFAAWFRTTVTASLSRFHDLDVEVSSLLARLSLSDLIGVVLILVAVVLVLWRLRWRLLNAPTLSSGSCPKCGGPLHRVHRKWYDRFICLYVPVRRYRCHNAECHWKGLRVGRHHESPRRRRSPSPAHGS